MAKQLLYGEEARKALQSGVDQNKAGDDFLCKQFVSKGDTIAHLQFVMRLEEVQIEPLCIGRTGEL